MHHPGCSAPAAASTWHVAIVNTLGNPESASFRTPNQIRNGLVPGAAAFLLDHAATQNTPMSLVNVGGPPLPVGDPLIELAHILEKHVSLHRPALLPASLAMHSTQWTMQRRPLRPGLSLPRMMMLRRAPVPPNRRRRMPNRLRRPVPPNRLRRMRRKAVVLIFDHEHHGTTSHEQLNVQWERTQPIGPTSMWAAA